MTNTPTDSLTCCFDTISVLPRSLFAVSSGGKGFRYSDMHFPHMHYQIYQIADCCAACNSTCTTIFLLPSEGYDHFQIFASPPRCCDRYAQSYLQEEGQD